MIFCSVAITSPPIRRGGALRRGEELNRLRREDRQLKLQRYPVSRDTPDDSRTGVDGSDFLDCLEAQNRAVTTSRGAIQDRSCAGGASMPTADCFHSRDIRANGENLGSYPVAVAIFERLWRLHGAMQ